MDLVIGNMRWENYYYFFLILAKRLRSLAKVFP